MSWFSSAVHAAGNVATPVLRTVGEVMNVAGNNAAGQHLIDTSKAISNQNVTLSNPTGLVNGGKAFQSAQPTPDLTLAQPITDTSGGTSGSGGGMTGGTAPSQGSSALDQAAIQNTQKSLDQLPSILDAALAANRQKYQNAENGFNAQEQQQRGQYDTGTTTNQQNYDSNFMDSLRSGAQGLSGLLSILRGTGVEGWANQAVRDTTAGDIRNGLDTRNQNQTALDTSFSNFQNDLKDKRQQNSDTLTNNEFAARGNSATQMQKLYTEMAKYYADAGDNATATHYLNLAGDQSAAIAKYGTAPVSAFDTNPVSVQAAPISAFSAPTNQSVSYDPGMADNKGLFTIGDVRRRLAGAGA